MRKTFRIIIIILAIIIIVFSGNKLWHIYLEYDEGKRLYDDYANRFIIKNTGVEETIEETPELITIDFDALLSENRDLVGWIYSENTPINYPIVQTSDNNYYLHRMLDGTHNIAGTIFMDPRNDPNLKDYNTIIYGHNMKNNTMFGSLQKYMEQDYYDNHPVIYYLTPDQNYEIQLVAGYVTEAWSDTYNIPQTIEEQNKLSQDMMSKSLFKTGVSFEEGDNIVTLSTCAYDFDGARYVVIGRLKALQ